ncbi:PAN2-PAN3 deadenylation complex subunit PAN3 [Aphelenchoides fujianensis]|nr:PAN2-PAN3 deadenylation complex subunit PAN3 [Aphelenchoides fujianensis]
MATFGSGHVPQAPSGSRLAQYLNGRAVHGENPATSSMQGGYGEQHRYPGNPINGYPADEHCAPGYSTDYNRGGGNMGGYISPASASYLRMASSSPDRDPQSLSRQEELRAINQNIPLLGLQVMNEDTLKQRWALSANSSFFTEPDLRTRLLQRQMAQQCYSTEGVDLPDSLEHFRHLKPIGRNPSMRIGSHVEHLYKAISTIDGLTYAVHRVTNVRQISGFAATQIENWRRISHSNVVRIHDLISTATFSDSSFLFVYDFQPLAESILKHFFHTNGTIKSKYVGNGVPGVNEQLVWNFIIQISCAIRTVHAASMAVYCLDLNRIIVNSSGRFMVSGVGITEVLTAEPTSNLLALQMEDLRMFGAVLMTLLSGSLQPVAPDRSGVPPIDMHYSADLRNVVKVLSHAPSSGRVTSINEIMPMIGARFYSHMESLQIRVDMLENDLCKELQNGRLFRLLGMLSTVCDRNLPKEPYWSETSERYMLKLFRDYVFHQVDGYGRPVLDLAHIVLNLNKLDSGVNETIQLASRDNENVLLVTYKDLRGYLESSFSYLRKEMDLDVSPDLKLGDEGAALASLGGAGVSDGYMDGGALFGLQYPSGGPGPSANQ